MQQVAAKTRITTRRNILTPDLLRSVWPRFWVQLIYSGGKFANLSAYYTTLNDKVSELWRWILHYVLFWRSHVLSLYLMTCNLHDWCSHLLSLATGVLTAWILIEGEIKVSLTSHEDSERGWNVGLPPLLWHLAQLGLESWQLHALSALYPSGKFLSNLFR